MIQSRTPAPDPIWDPLLTTDFARRVVDYQPAALTMSRLETLRDRANAGTLSDAEHAEYEQLIENLDLVAILQAKARAALDRLAS